MLQCVPAAANEYIVYGVAAAVPAMLQLDRLKYDGQTYYVVKRRGSWNLERAGDTFAQAYFKSAFGRAVEIRYTRALLLLKQTGEGHAVYQGDRLLGTLRHDRWFTHAEFECDAQVSELIQVFILYLVAMFSNQVRQADSD